MSFACNARTKQADSLIFTRMRRHATQEAYFGSPVTTVDGQAKVTGSALLEATEIDERRARYVNDDLAEYFVSVNADVREVEAILIPDEDVHVNPLGLKGLGELGIIGANAAIANAVYHATARRVRALPIRIEALL